MGVETPNTPRIPLENEQHQHSKSEVIEETGASRQGKARPEAAIPQNQGRLAECGKAGDTEEEASERVAKIGEMSFSKEQ